MSRAFVNEDAGSGGPVKRYALPDRNDPDYDRLAAAVLLEAAREGETASAEQATGYYWGEPKLHGEVRRTSAGSGVGRRPPRAVGPPLSPLTMPQIYHIVPAVLRPWWALLPLLVLASIVVLGLATIRGARGATFELSAEGLRLKGDLYGRFIPAGRLLAKDAARVEIKAGQFRPTSRTLGTALPGYRVGWFHLANGNKALLYVTDPTRVVFVPTTAGYSILLSVRETDQFVDQMHALAHP